MAVGGAAGEVLAEGVDVLADGTAGAHAISTTVNNANPSAVRGGLVIIVQTRVSVYPACLESRSRPASLTVGNV